MQMAWHVSPCQSTDLSAASAAPDTSCGPVSHADLTCFTCAGLGDLPNLNTVILKSNLITELQGIFRGCTRLEKLSMANNEISEFGNELVSLP